MTTPHGLPVGPVVSFGSVANGWRTNPDGSMSWAPSLTLPKYEQPVAYGMPGSAVTLCLCHEPCLSNPGGHDVVKQDEGLTVVRCRACGTLRVLEPFDPAEYRRLYVEDDLYHIKRMEERGYATYYDRALHDERLAEGRLRRLRPHCAAGLLLDVGCSNGALVRVANRSGYSALGIEINPHMAAFARAAGGAPVAVLDIAVEGELLLLGGPARWGGGFDVALFHDVMEHFLDPRAALRGAFKILRRGGILVVDTPDASSPQALEKGAAWHHIKPLEHPWLFSRALLERLITGAGFDVLDADIPILGKCVLYSRKGGA